MIARPRCIVSMLVRNVIGSMLVGLLWCGCGDNRPVAAEEPSLPPRSMHALEQTGALMQARGMALDSAFCDSAVTSFMNDEVARQRPDLLIGAARAVVSAHRAFPPVLADSLRSLAVRSKNAGLLAWYGALMARHHMLAGDDVVAMRYALGARHAFVEANDDPGLMYADRIIGPILLDHLGQAAESLPYLREFQRLVKDTLEQAQCLNYLGDAYAQLGAIDSAADCLAGITDLMGGLAPGSVNVGICEHLYAGLDFNIMLARSRKDVGLPIATLRESYQRLRALQQRHGQTHKTRYEVITCVDYARELVRLGLHQEADRILREAQRISEVCRNCRADDIRLFAALADRDLQQGDAAAALHFRTLQLERMEEQDVRAKRMDVHRVMEVTRLEEDRQEIERDRERERSTVREHDREHRMQRVQLTVMIGFIILFAGVLFVRLRTRRRIQLEQVRTRLSRDLHDDIGSTLSSINILTSLARRKAEAGDVEGATASLSGISERSQRLQRDMSDIVWSVDPDRDTLEELLVRMREFGASVLEPKGISYRFDSQGNFGTALPPMVKSNLYLIFKEAVNNAAKHAQATEVTVAVDYRADRLHMAIADDGQGLPDTKTTDCTGGGNGLRNMRKRAEEMKADLRIESTTGKGTVIALAIPL